MAACRSFLLLLAVGVLSPVDFAVAVEQFELSLGDLHGPGWSAHAVVVQLRLASDDAGELLLKAERLQLPEPVGGIDMPVVSCRKFRVEALLLECKDGTLRTSNRKLGSVRASLRFSYRLASGALEFAAEDLAFSGGQASVKGGLEGENWRLRLHAKAVQLQELIRFAKGFGFETDYRASGSIDVTLRGQGRKDLPGRFQLSGALAGVSFHDPAGIHAGEGLGLTVSADLRRSGRYWEVRAGLQGNEGQIYIDPLFVEIADRPVLLELATRWAPGQKTLTIDSLRWLHPDTVDSTSTVQLQVSPEFALTAIDTEIRAADLSGLYKTYVKPWLLGTMGGDLDLAGSLKGRVRFGDGAVQSLQLDLGDVSLSDTLGRVQLDGLQGNIDWGADEAERRSSFSWTGAGLFRADIGAASVPVISRGLRFELAQQVPIPVLDGTLLINQWELAHPGGADMRWAFDGTLTPISMKALTAALDWPELSGKLSGMIPQVSYDDGVLKVGGVLLVRAFDGEITVRNLELEQPFGVVPRLLADLEVKELDLKTLTRTFSFGKIEGRFGGYVRDLRMEQWRPVAFDAELKTPDGDKSRHRISQRALDNLSSIGGGGVGGALSRSFLRMFEDFPYRRLGISCRLQNGVCSMDGVAPTETGGYYIVQGRLLPPRVDVVGYANRVDWTTLIDQLVAATVAEGSPTIQ